MIFFEAFNKFLKLLFDFKRELASILPKKERDKTITIYIRERLVLVERLKQACLNRLKNLYLCVASTIIVFWRKCILKTKINLKLFQEEFERNWARSFLMSIYLRSIFKLKRAQKTSISLFHFIESIFNRSVLMWKSVHKLEPAL